MDFKRTILYFMTAILGVMLWHAWVQDHPVSQSAQSTTADQVAQHPAEFEPSSYTSSGSHVHASLKKITQIIPENKMISVQTNVLDARINLRGGNLVSAKLLQYPVSLKEKNISVQILNSNNDTLYIAQNGVISATGHTGTVIYHAAKSDYVMTQGQKQLQVMLTGETAQGLQIEKTFTFTRDQYAIQTAMQVKNTTSAAWSGSAYHQITRRYVPEDDSFYSRAYTGGAVSTENTPYKKLPFSTMSENNFTRDIVDGWVAMQQHYFLSVWVAPKAKTFHYYSRSFGPGDEGKNNIFVLGYVSPQVTLSPGQTDTFQSTFYVGPEIAKQLEKLGRGLDLTVDYGWLWPISKFLFWLLSEIEHFIGNWGWSIVVVTVIIKIAFYWFSNKSYHSMARMRDMQPRIQALKDRFGDDKQAMSKAMMELYRKEKINPVGGCLPMVIQIPVFIALYYVLIESVELRQAPFIFWIHDLSVKDPYFIFPILMGISMLVQQKLSPPPPDPTQAKMMMMLPVVFTVFFATFPAGLVLYWLTNNCASVLQQWVVMKTYKAPKKKHQKK